MKHGIGISKVHHQITGFKILFTNHKLKPCSVVTRSFHSARVAELGKGKIMKGMEDICNIHII